MTARLAFAAALAAAMFGLGQAQAAELFFTETTTASGSLNGVAFTNKLITFSGAADTSNIFSLAPGASDLDVPLSVTVQGLGTAHFTDEMIVFGTPIGVVHSVGFTDRTLKQGLLNIVLPSTSYDLSTPFGPVTGTTGIPKPLTFATDDGAFVISGTPLSVTFQAVLAPVPEPSTWLMMIGGLGMLGATLRRRRTPALA